MNSNVKVHIQGRGDLEVPADIAASDETLIAALAPFYDAIDTAEITREEKDGQTTITIVPTGGRKAGTDPQPALASLDRVLADLIVTPATFNPAVSLLQQLERDGIVADPLRLLPLIPQIDAALAAADAEVEAVQSLTRTLIAQRAAPASFVPRGL